MEIQYLDYKGVKIKLFCNENAKKGVIAVHGFGGSFESSAIAKIADTLCKKDYFVVTFNLPHHGNDDLAGFLSIEDCFRYIKTVEEFVKNKFGNAQLSLFATSFGGYLALRFLKYSKVKYENVILRSPAVFIQEIIKKFIFLRNYDFESLYRGEVDLGNDSKIMIDYNFFKSIDETELDDFKTDYFLNIIQGKKDDIVDFQKNERFFLNHCNGKLKFFYFENADHRYKKPGEIEKIVETVCEILKVK